MQTIRSCVHDERKNKSTLPPSSLPSPPSTPPAMASYNKDYVSVLTQNLGRGGSFQLGDAGVKINQSTRAWHTFTPGLTLIPPPPPHPPSFARRETNYTYYVLLNTHATQNVLHAYKTIAYCTYVIHTDARTETHARTDTETDRHARARTHTHTRTDIHTHTYARAHTHIHTHTHARAHTHTYTHAHTRTHTHKHTHTHTRTHTHTHAHTDTRARTDTHASTHTYSHKHTHLSLIHI